MQMSEPIPTLVALVIAGLVLPLSIFGGLAISHSSRKARGERIEQGDSLLQRVADLLKGLYLPGKPYAHPIIGSIPESGRVVLEIDGFLGTLMIDPDTEATYLGTALLWLNPRKGTEASIPTFHKRFFLFREPKLLGDAFFSANPQRPGQRFHPSGSKILVSRAHRASKAVPV